MRFLCLHGMGTNSKVLELQTAALRHELGALHKFEFVEGSIPSPPAPGVEKLFPATDEFFSYYSPDSASSIVSVLNDLEEYVTEDGPFDAVMGFSQGAALAATLMIRRRLREPLAKPVFDCAVFLCAGVPYDPIALQKGKIRFLDPKVDGVLIDVPTAHIVGARDEALQYSMELQRLCVQKSSRLFDHGGGHDVPKSPLHVTSAMAEVVEEVVRVTLFQQ